MRKLCLLGKGLEDTVHFTLSTCYAQQNPTQGHPTSPLSLLQKLVHVVRRECFVNRGIPVDDIVYTNSADAYKPCYHNRCKKESQSMGPIMLERKQEYQYDTCNWDFYICRIKEQTSNLQFSI